MDIKEPIHVKLRKLRKEQGLSQNEVAEYLNLSRQAISQWETGKVYPDIENVVLLCDLYNISSDELLGVKKEKSHCAKEDEGNKDNQEIKEQNQILEIIGLAVVLVLFSQIPVLGIVVPIAIVIWLQHCKKRYHIIYVLCLTCFIIGGYNTYVLLGYFLKDFGNTAVEAMK